MTKKGKAKPRIPTMEDEMELEPMFNCKSYYQWSENEDEDTFWNCRKNLAGIGGCKCREKCQGFELKKEATR